MACNLGTFTVRRTGTCSQTVAIGRFEIEPSCSVFPLNYLKSGGRKKLQSIFSSSVFSCVTETETFHRVTSRIFNQQLELLNLNYLEYLGGAAPITSRVN